MASLLNIGWNLSETKMADMKNPTIFDRMLAFFRQILTALARALAFSIFTYYYKEIGLAVVLGLHIFLSASLPLLITTSDCKCESVVLGMAHNIMLLFTCDFGEQNLLLKRATRRPQYLATYSLFYFLYFIENTGMIMAWYFRQNIIDEAVEIALLTLVPGCTLLGSILMVVQNVLFKSKERGESVSFSFPGRQSSVKDDQPEVSTHM